MPRADAALLFDKAAVLGTETEGRLSRHVFRVRGARSRFF
jgi:hypothetical protein